MIGIEHNKILAIGFGMFAAILGFTFLLLMTVSFGVFVALGISFANETGNGNQAGIGILGGVFAVIFYVLLGAIFVIPTALATLENVETKTERAQLGNYRRDLSRSDHAAGNDIRHLRFVVFLQR